MKASELASAIPDCCSEVLDAMFFTAVLGSLDAAPELEPGEDATMSFSLRFVGDVCGRFSLHLQQATARSLAANFLGEAETDISPTEISQVIGELANMICGSVLSRVEAERSFALSPPQPSSIAAPDDSDSVVVSTIEIESGVITIWIAIEGSQCPS